MHSSQPENTPLSTWLRLVYLELFDRIKVPLKIVKLPEKRASIDAEDGKVDGQFTRIFSYQNFYPNQIRVNVPVVRVSILALAKSDADIHFDDGWRSLKGSQVRVGYMRGILLVEKNVTKRIPLTDISAANNIEQGLMKLKHGRTDVFIHSNLALFPFLNSDVFRNDIAPAGIMQSADLFPYVNIKHRALVPQLEKTLREMKEEGVIRQYCYKAFGDDADKICNDALPL
ncbi:hypothetical protein L3Q72_17855 [Vibrio sp. JC009]|uniref:substrate-binding periplasmic protein n=1 Tax=Vibrio sp. JC009 TaxID=2912314 RepID=UPI0023AF6FD2|nr:transporter substrate-binding domain-containing protein [Vibrio sp. JC009]WED24741.1 hypothetical protein L3Q72_17855 [Vibrio sp. JC009]